MTRRLEIRRCPTTKDYHVVVLDPHGHPLVVQANIRTQEKAEKVLRFWHELTEIPIHETRP